MHSMNLPFLKNKQKQNMGGGEPITEMRESDDSDTALLHHIADELLTAIDKKDAKSLREALQALILNITDKE